MDRVMAHDFRGHGATFTTNDADLSVATLRDDTIALLKELYCTATKEPPIFVLAGHSMGGAIAVKVAVSGKLPSMYKPIVGG